MAALNEKIEEAELLLSLDFPNDAKVALQEMIDNAKTINSGSSKNEIEKSISDLSGIVNNINELIPVYDSMLNTFATYSIFEQAAIKAIIITKKEEFNNGIGKTATEIKTIESELINDVKKCFEVNFTPASVELINPDIQGSNDNKADIDGWEIISNGNKTNVGQHYSDKTQRYLDGWSGAKLNYKATQILEDLPNGLYVLKVAARSSSTVGSFVYANNDEIAIDPILSIGNEAEGWNWYKVYTVVTDGKISVGVKTDPNKLNNGEWIGAVDFSLERYGHNSVPTDIDNNIEAKSIYVYAVNNEVKVVGTDKYSIYSIDGKMVSLKSKLTKGVYYVVAEGVSYPVVIK